MPKYINWYYDSFNLISGLKWFEMTVTIDFKWFRLIYTSINTFTYVIDSCVAWLLTFLFLSERRIKNIIFKISFRLSLIPEESYAILNANNVV